MLGQDPDMKGHADDERKDGRVPKSRKYLLLLSVRTTPDQFVKKYEVSQRMVMNASYPHKFSTLGSFTRDEDYWSPLDKNLYTEIRRCLLFDWPGIESLSETIAAMHYAGVILPSSGGLSDRQRQILKVWAQECEGKMEDGVKQSRLVSINPYNDDLVVLVLGETAAQRVDQSIEEDMRRFGIEMSRKEKDSRLFGTT